MLFIEERLDVVDYIAPAGSTALRFVFREPPLAYITNIFTLPFTGTVWLAIFICILACALFLYIASKWEASMGMVRTLELLYYYLIDLCCGNFKLRHHLLPYPFKMMIRRLQIRRL